MPETIHEPLHYEAMGIAGAPPMMMVHPNPMDSAWAIYQLAHFSTWFRTIAVDLPGYGRSPTAAREVTMPDVAQACWDVVDVESAEPAVLLGCSVGANVVQHMYHLRPERSLAIILTGTGYTPPSVGTKPLAPRRIAGYTEAGLDYRWQYTLEDFSPGFAQTEMAEWFARLFTERNGHADLETIIAMFHALGQPDPGWLAGELYAPVLILTGSEDKAHQRAFDLRDRLPDAELFTVQGAGHACQIEQPWVFDREVIAFLQRRGLWPEDAADERPPTAS